MRIDGEGLLRKLDGLREATAIILTGGAQPHEGRVKVRRELESLHEERLGFLDGSTLEEQYGLEMVVARRQWIDAARLFTERDCFVVAIRPFWTRSPRISRKPCRSWG